MVYLSPYVTSSFNVTSKRLTQVCFVSSDRAHANVRRVTLAPDEASSKTEDVDRRAVHSNNSEKKKKKKTKKSSSTVLWKLRIQRPIWIRSTSSDLTGVICVRCSITCCFMPYFCMFSTYKVPSKVWRTVEICLQQRDHACYWWRAGVSRT